MKFKHKRKQYALCFCIISLESRVVHQILFVGLSSEYKSQNQTFRQRHENNNEDSHTEGKRIELYLFTMHKYVTIFLLLSLSLSLSLSVIIKRAELQIFIFIVYIDNTSPPVKYHAR